MSLERGIRMPEDLPKAILTLIWLLSGVILFGWLLMKFSTMYSFIFALVFFGLPVLINMTKNKT